MDLIYSLTQKCLHGIGFSCTNITSPTPYGTIELALDQVNICTMFSILSVLERQTWDGPKQKKCLLFACFMASVFHCE